MAGVPPYLKPLDEKDPQFAEQVMGVLNLVDGKGALEGKIKALISLYIGRELPVQINDSSAMIETGPELTYNQRWLISKRQIARDILKYTDIKEIAYIEKYNTHILGEKATE